MSTTNTDLIPSSHIGFRCLVDRHETTPNNLLVKDETAVSHHHISGSVARWTVTNPPQHVSPGEKRRNCIPSSHGGIRCSVGHDETAPTSPCKRRDSTAPHTPIEIWMAFSWREKEPSKQHKYYKFKSGRPCDCYCETESLTRQWQTPCH